MGGSEMDVLYIGGFGRSGSTVLERMIAQLLGPSFGELSNYWLHGVIGNRRCSCSATFSECSFWSAVTAHDSGLLDQRLARRMVAVHQHVLRTRNIHHLWSEGGRAAIERTVSTEYFEALSSLYRAVSHVSHSKLVVDSSKHPVYAFLLYRATGVRLHLTHLVRDPRGVAFSWTRYRSEPGTHGTTEMQRLVPRQSALIWSAWNYSFQVLRSSLRLNYALLRYEDLVQDPQGTLTRLLGSLGLNGSDRQARSAGPSIASSQTHSISGNPNRFLRGPITVSADDEWLTNMSAYARLQVTFLTLPLLHTYRYGCWPTQGTHRKAGH